MSFKIIVWCTDCGNGQDPYGCFDGASETLDERFDTREEADAAVVRKQRECGAPWQYDVETDDRGEAGDG